MSGASRIGTIVHEGLASVPVRPFPVAEMFVMVMVPKFASGVRPQERPSQVVGASTIHSAEDVAASAYVIVLVHLHLRVRFSMISWTPVGRTFTDPWTSSPGESL